MIPPLLTDGLFLTMAVITVLLTGIGKGGFGGGAGNLGVPLLAQAVSPAVAAGVSLPLLLVMDVANVWAYRRDWDRALMRHLLPGAAIGIVIGALTFRYLSDRAVLGMVGALALGFVVFSLVRARLFGALPPARRNPVKGLFWASISGFTSTIAHAGGPPLAVYVLPLRLDRRVLTATTGVYFFVVNLAKVPPYLVNGQIDTDIFLTALALSPLAPLGVWLGVWLNRRVSERVFYIVIYTLMALTGVKLLWDAFVR